MDNGGDHRISDSVRERMRVDVVFALLFHRRDHAGDE